MTRAARRSAGVPPGSFDEVYRLADATRALARIDASVLDADVLALQSVSGLVGEDLARYRAALDALLRRARRHRRPLVLDLGCGLGGLTRWLAGELAVDAVGIDRSPVAVARGAGALAGAGAPLLAAADFEALPLPAASTDGAVSLDALYLAERPARALRSVHRVLRPGAFLLFTAYLPTGAGPEPWTSLLGDERFEPLAVADRSEAWRAWMLAKHRNRWDARERVRAELGDVAAAFLEVSQAVTGCGGSASSLDGVRRYEFLAVRR